MRMRISALLVATTATLAMAALLASYFAPTPVAITTVIDQAPRGALVATLKAQPHPGVQQALD